MLLVPLANHFPSIRLNTKHYSHKLKRIICYQPTDMTDIFSFVLSQTFKIHCLINKVKVLGFFCLNEMKAHNSQRKLNQHIMRAHFFDKENGRSMKAALLLCGKCARTHTNSCWNFSMLLKWVKWKRGNYRTLKEFLLRVVHWVCKTVNKPSIETSVKY